jgi:hypothetical protein
MFYRHWELYGDMIVVLFVEVLMQQYLPIGGIASGQLLDCDGSRSGRKSRAVLDLVLSFSTWLLWWMLT